MRSENRNSRQARLLARCSALAVVLGAASLASSQAAAQDVGAQPDGSGAAERPTDTVDAGEIVVTARYRSETLQHAPIAITAVNSDLIEKQGLQSVQDVAQNAPNVVLTSGSDQSGGRSVAAIIRGVGQTSFQFAQSPGVGFYMDEVYFGTLFGSDFDIGDVDRVEVLRGPQGTLFGRNSEGGAVRVFTKNATGEGGGMVDVGYGTRNHVRVLGNFDTTLVDDKLFARVSAGVDSQDGYVDRIDFACRNPTLRGNLPYRAYEGDCKVGELGGKKTYSGRIALRALPTDNLTIDLKVNGLLERDQAAPMKAVDIKNASDGVDPVSGLPYGAAGRAYAVNYLIPTYGMEFDDRFLNTGKYESYAVFDDLRTGLHYPEHTNIDQIGGSLRVNWDLPFATVTSITGYEHYTGRAGDNPTASPLPGAFTDVSFRHTQWSEELRLGGENPIGGLDLEWTVGGYYYIEHDLEGGNIAIDFLDQVFGQNDPARDEVISPFAHAVLHLTDKLSIEGGWRLTHEEKSYTFVRTYLLLNGENVIGQNIQQFPGVSKATSTTKGRNDFKANITYQFTPDLMVYGTIATGFKSGGINPIPTLASQIVPFGPETLTSYEAGLRASLFGGLLRINPTVYYNDYKGLQRTAPVTDPSGAPFSSLTNVGQVHIKGVELEVSARPFHGFTIDASGSYLDYVTVDLGGATGINPDIRPPLVPEWQGHVGAQYTLDMDDLSSFSLRLDYRYQTKVFFDQRGSPTTAQGAYGLLNGQLSWTSPDENWRVTLEGKNLTNKYYYYWMSNFETVHGVTNGSIGEPREFLLSVRRSF